MGKIGLRGEGGMREQFRGGLTRSITCGVHERVGEHREIDHDLTPFAFAVTKYRAPPEIVSFWDERDGWNAFLLLAYKVDGANAYNLAIVPRSKTRARGKTR
jgi:hypothetical protein